MAIRKFSASTIKGGTKLSKFWDQNTVMTTAARVLVLAGGGSAGAAGVGGGASGAGAGGLLYYGTETPKTPNGSELTLNKGTTYTVTVGAGGAVPTSTPNAYGRKGSNSVFSGNAMTSLIAIGGGAGNSREFNIGECHGGCGGGAGEYPDATINAAGIPGQGYDGGDGYTNGGGGGGGGTGAAGTTSTSSNGGSGGNGLQYSITGTAIYYGGGGGGSVNGGTGGAPGLGGGGDGGAGSGGTAYGANRNGGTNLGGGGGGAYTGSAGAGGSGVVILSLDQAATSTTGSPTTSTSNGRYIYKFTGDGSITI